MEEEGGRAHRIKPNETQCLTLRLKNNNNPRPFRIHPTRLSTLIPRGGQSMIYSRFSAPSSVACRGLVAPI